MWFNESLFTQTNTNIFVFGSNLAGKHGAGAAKFAVKYCGAVYGQAVGLQGKSYAIPTKNELIQTLPLTHIAPYIGQFLHFAENNPQLTFYVTPIGTGLAGYQHHHIAPMFKEAPLNCILPSEWQVRDNLPLFPLDKPSE